MTSPQAQRVRGIRNFTSRRTSCTEMQVPAHPATAF
jgi:hypothetical protein